jgi:hypothetical protein
VIETDASKTVGGGGSMSHSKFKDGGTLESFREKMHINVLELKAGGFSIQSLTKHRQNIYIHIKSDNKTLVAYLNKMGGGKRDQNNYNK